MTLPRRPSLLAAVRAAAAAGAILLVLPGCPSKDGDRPAPGSDKKPAAASGAPKSGDQRTVASIGGETITVGDLSDQINRQSPFVRARYTNPEQKKKFLDDLVKREVMAQAAAAKGFDKDPDVVQTMKKVMVQKLIREEFDRNFKESDIPDSELQEFYKKNESDYHQPEMVRLSHIYFRADDSDKAKARKESEEVLRDLKNRANDYNAFRDAAKKYSDATDDTEKQGGGDLNYQSLADLTAKTNAKVAEAGFALKTVGDISDLIEAEDGFHIVKLTGRRRAIDRGFDQVKNQIKNRLAREKRTESYDAWVEGLMKAANVQINEAMLAEVQVAAGGTGAADALPAGSLGQAAGEAPAIPGGDTMAPPGAPGGEPGGAPEAAPGAAPGAPGTP